MRKRHVIGLTTALLGLAATAADRAPALAGEAAAGYSQSAGVHLQLPVQLSPPAAGNTGPDFWWPETFTQTPCSGDFGVLGNAEAPQVTQANPTNAAVCD